MHSICSLCITLWNCHRYAPFKLNTKYQNNKNLERGLHTRQFFIVNHLEVVPRLQNVEFVDLSYLQCAMIDHHFKHLQKSSSGADELSKLHTNMSGTFVSVLFLSKVHSHWTCLIHAKSTCITDFIQTRNKICLYFIYLASKAFRPWAWLMNTCILAWSLL